MKRDDKAVRAVAQRLWRAYVNAQPKAQRVLYRKRFDDYTSESDHPVAVGFLSMARMVLRNSKVDLQKIKLNVKNIVIASQDDCIALQPYINQILDALGYPGALVTDESALADFLDSRAWPTRVGNAEGWFERPADPKAIADNEAFIAKLRTKLNIQVETDDYIVDIARRLKSINQQCN